MKKGVSLDNYKPLFEADDEHYIVKGLKLLLISAYRQKEAAVLHDRVWFEAEISGILRTAKRLKLDVEP
jgi:hypothetical protein